MVRIFCELTMKKFSDKEITLYRYVNTSEPVLVHLQPISTNSSSNNSV